MFKIPEKIDDYVTLLEAGTPFTHTNIGGDGEFLTMVGWGGINSDGVESTPEKAEALARVILEPRLTLHGYNPGKNGSPKRADAEAWLRERGVNVPSQDATLLYDTDFGDSKINVPWVHKEIISSANVRGRLGPFLKVLRGRPLLMVGPDWIEPFRQKMGAEGYLLPRAIGWGSLAEIEKELREEVARLPSDAVVTLSLGYLSKVLTWRLAPDFPSITQIDVGACFDPYCGVLNRHGYKRPEWPDMMAKNLGSERGDRL